MYNNNIISYQAQLAYKLWKSDYMFCVFFSLITVDFSEIFTYTDIGTKLNDTVAVSNEESCKTLHVEILSNPHTAPDYHVIKSSNS